MSRQELIHALGKRWKCAVWPLGTIPPLAAAASDAATKQEQIERALKVLRKDGPIEMLRGRGIFMGSPSDGKVAFLFTGQGSQYIDMGLDLAEVYPVVAGDL